MLLLRHFTLQRCWKRCVFTGRGHCEFDHQPLVLFFETRIYEKNTGDKNWRFGTFLGKMFVCESVSCWSCLIDIFFDNPRVVFGFGYFFSWNQMDIIHDMICFLVLEDFFQPRFRLGKEWQVETLSANGGFVSILPGANDQKVQSTSQNDSMNCLENTLPETNIAMENSPLWWYLPGKMGFSWAMLVSGRVDMWFSLATTR